MGVDWMKAVEYYKKVKEDGTQICFVSDEVVAGKKVSFNQHGAGFYVLNKDSNTYESDFIYIPLKKERTTVHVLEKEKMSMITGEVVDGDGVKTTLQHYIPVANGAVCKSYRVIREQVSEIKARKARRFRFLSDTGIDGFN